MARFPRTLVLFALCCGLAAPACAREDRPAHGVVSEAAPAATTRFDYYVLALSWSPAFCQKHRSDPQCSPEKRFGFVLHGLWPQLNSPRRISSCPTSQRLTEQARDFGRTVFPTEKLMVHEWQKHGTCSGMSALEYFRRSDEARDNITIPPQFEPGSRTQTMTAAQVMRTLRDVNPAITGQSIVVTCSGPELAEVRVCLSKDLRPQRCGSGVRSACRPGPIRIRGVQ